MVPLLLKRDGATVRNLLSGKKLKSAGEGGRVVSQLAGKK
jgi:hypothetical protein